MQSGCLRAPEMHAPRSPGCHRLGALAKQVLIAEVELTPKPGLVDRRGSGAHHDLNLELIRRSATVLEPYFSRIAVASAGRNVDTDLREELAAIGRDAERAMYRETGGSNTHKGAIWALGLLVGAAAACEEQASAQVLASMAGALARLPDRARPAVLTHGEMAWLRYGAVGARGEAANGFPHITRYGLPTLRLRRAAGCSQEVGRLDTLLAIMARLDDTCILYRGGPASLSAVQSGAQAVLAAGGSGTSRGRQQLRDLDREMLARGISPGGSADMLAATIFLDAVERRQHEIAPDQSEEVESHGAA